MLPSSYHFSVGQFDCLAVSDGTARYPVRSFFCNAPEDELERAMAPYEVLDGRFRTPLNPLVIQADVLTVLIDTGLGLNGPANAGKLLANLADEDITPADIDLVVLSHAHFDHTGGAIDAAGRPVFEQARYILSEAEYTFWQSDVAQSLDATFAEQVRGFFQCLQPRLELVPAGATLLPGVRTIPVPGHTPGQIAVHIESDGEQIIYTADTFAHPLHLEHPEWNIISDMDQEQAVQTRYTLLDRAEDESISLYVYHCPLPSLYDLGPG
jgi:glyoxylase-like metal-dependent hydrolase (beta-lactamase superfamily II)